MGKQIKDKDTVRINKYIADTGFCSRREADQLIIDERVTINGILANPGDRVKMTDKVKIDGEILKLRVVLPVKEEKKPAKKDFVPKSQREKIDYRVRERKNGTRGGERNKRAKVITSTLGDKPSSPIAGTSKGKDKKGLSDRKK